jgi:two-component system sensor histidine kinase FlrB
VGLTVVPAIQKSAEQRELAQAFDQFNQLSRQLSDSYSKLELRVADLTSELNEVSQQRAIAVREKEGLAARLNELIDFLPGGVVVLNSEGKIQQCNPAAINLLGEPLQGETWLSVIKRCFLPRRDDGHEASTVDGRRLGIATGAMQAQGQIILITDLTQTRQLQDRLNRQERLASMGKMVSALAHQIRTPLSAATLYASHLLGDGLTSEKREKFSRKLSQRLQHMEHQVRDMLLFVKGDLAVNDSLSVEELAQDLKAAIEPLQEAVHLQCHWQNSCPTRQLRCNRDVLIGALMNLVNNAVQASKNDLRLDILFECSDDEKLSIRITDNGPGISADSLVDCQEAFVTTKSQGIGLGLSVVGIVVRAHGGEFNLRSLEQRGTQAQMLLPLRPMENLVNTQERAQ